MPGTDIALTGPAVDRERIGRYLDQSLALASRLGVKVIVFGSPGARSYPAGFSAETTINRKDWGIEFNVPLKGEGALLGDKVNLALEIQAVRA